MAYGGRFPDEFARLTPALLLAETEDSWKRIDVAIGKLDSLTKEGAYKHDEYVFLLKEHSFAIVNALLSERTRLSGTAADLLNSAAPRLAQRFEGLVSTFVPALLHLCARTNKVALVRAKKCLLLIAKHCKLPSLLPYLCKASQDKSGTLRTVSVEVSLTLMEAMEGTEKIGRRVSDVEKIIRHTATDRDPEVRQWCRRVFELYSSLWPDRTGEFSSSFTPTTRRYLSITDSSLGDEAHRAVQVTMLSPAKRKVPQRSQKTVDALLEQKGEAQRDKEAFITSQKTPSLHQFASPSLTTGTSRTKTLCTSAEQKCNTVSSKPMITTSPSPAKQNASCRSIKPISMASGKLSSNETGQERAQKAQMTLEEEHERDVLRQEIARLSSATPSRRIAARLALERFEAQMRRKAGQAQQTENGPRAALAAFAVAASKKQSPKRLPSRVPLASSPTIGVGIGRTASVVSAQRVVRPTSDPVSLLPGAVVTDVFGSRPMPEGAMQSMLKRESSTKATGKVSSSLTKGLGARSKLLRSEGQGGTGHTNAGVQRHPIRSQGLPAAKNFRFFAVDVSNQMTSSGRVVPDTISSRVFDDKKQAKRARLACPALALEGAFEQCSL